MSHNGTEKPAAPSRRECIAPPGQLQQHFHNSVSIEGISCYQMDSHSYSLLALGYVEREQSSSYWKLFAFQMLVCLIIYQNWFFYSAIRRIMAKIKYNEKIYLCLFSLSALQEKVHKARTMSLLACVTIFYLFIILWLTKRINLTFHWISLE